MSEAIATDTGRRVRLIVGERARYNNRLLSLDHVDPSSKNCFEAKPCWFIVLVKEYMVWGAIEHTAMSAEVVNNAVDRLGH